MANYHFKRNVCAVNLVNPYTSSRYPIVSYPDLSFSQTFEEQARNVKTLHDQSAMFEDAVINRANPANFNFTFLVNDSLAASEIIFEYAFKSNANRDGSYRELNDFDLYIDTGVDIFRLEFAIIERLTLQISNNALVTATVQGTARRLSTFASTGTALPGTVPAGSTTRNVTGIIPRAVRVDLGGVEQPNVANINIELVNQVEWLNYDTLHKSLSVTSASDSMLPEAFVVSNKQLTGSITQFLTDTNDTNLQTWSTTTSLRIQVGRATNVFDIDINLPKVAITNRLETGDIFTQISDFRMISSPDLSTVFDIYF